MNKTLKDNKLDVEFLERIIEDWKDCNDVNESEEFKTISKMLNEKDYKNWECIYRIIKDGEDELTDEYVKLYDTILDRNSEIILEEYFDSTIVLFEKTKGLFICKEDFETGKFRITLYRHNNSDHKMVGKE